MILEKLHNKVNPSHRFLKMERKWTGNSLEGKPSKKNENQSFIMHSSRAIPTLSQMYYAKFYPLSMCEIGSYHVALDSCA